MKESDFLSKSIGVYETFFDTIRVKTRIKQLKFSVKLRLAEMSSSFVRWVLKYLTFEKLPIWLIIIRMFPYFLKRESSWNNLL